MSQVLRLKQTLNGLAQSAKQTGHTLGAFDGQLKRYNQEVQQAISGSSQRKDQEIMQAIAAAQKAVSAATSALQNAAQIAQRYAQSI
ncbi:MAG TPA: hypothetical protein PLL54_10295 [Dermatophilaceae bacterium]|jgi:hypothetical protein|nr:hypothetical protein [Dermatophilaceae bacterium]